MATWVSVASAADVPPGERLVVELGRQWIVVFNVDGRFYALEDTCSHEEYPLSDGELDGHAIECAKHGARFDVRDGSVLAAPAFRPVRTYPTRVEDGQIQIGKK